MPEIAPDTLIDGRYRVLSRLGAGGMADVFLAEDQQLGRRVALKLLYRRFAEDPGFVERFRREAQAAAGLQHPNVVSVYDRGGYDGTYYIAMEYLPGRSLKQLIRQEAPLEPVRAIDITLQILKAARFAHRHGVIHRDLKPHNVIVDDSDQAKVTDFGIARAGASDMTETGSIMGTAQYLSPEQAQGHAVSAGSDLYSVGVVLYELLTGRVPFDAEAAVTIALKHVSESPLAPSVINPGVPPELEQVVLWSLNKNPADRPTDADQLITALEQAKAAIVSGVSGQHTSSMAALAGVGAVGGEFLAPPTDTVSATSPPVFGPLAGDGAGVLTEPPPGPRRRRTSPWLWGVLVALLIVGAGVAAYLISRPTKKPVPVVIGQTLNVARTQLQNAGFAVSVLNVSSNEPVGQVIGEAPPGGAKADEGATITLTVSQGPGNATVPSVAGLPLAQAKQAITRAGLKPGRVVDENSDTFPAGQVVDTEPAAGQTPTVGTAVTLFVSSGKAKVTVPDVRGESQGTATSTLSAAGFKVTTSNQGSSTVNSGDVISQTPAGGSSALPGATVNLVIATTPTVSVPSVQGQTLAAATGTLTAAGFSVSNTTRNVSNRSQDGLVLSQSPAGGSSAKKGSKVSLVIGHFTGHTPTTTTPTTPRTNTTSTTT